MSAVFTKMILTNNGRLNWGSTEVKVLKKKNNKIFTSSNFEVKKLSRSVTWKCCIKLECDWYLLPWHKTTSVREKKCQCWCTWSFSLNYPDLGAPVRCILLPLCNRNKQAPLTYLTLICLSKDHLQKSIIKVNEVWRVKTCVLSNTIISFALLTEKILYVYVCYIVLYL